MQKFRLTILLIICSNGLAYAQTFNETPILPFMPQKEMKFPKISGLPDIRVLCQKRIRFSATACH